MAKTILISTQFFDKDQAGGGVQTSIESNIHYNREGTNTVILCARTSKIQKQYEQYGGFTIFRYQSIKLLYKRYYIPSLSGVFFMIKILNKVIPNTIITETRFYISHLVVALYAKIKKINYIHVEHGSSLVKDGGTIIKLIATIYDYTFGRLLIKLAKQVKARSYSAQKFSLSVLKAKKVTVEIIMPKVDWPPNNNIPSDHFNLLYLGRVERAKGVFELVDSIQYLNKASYGVHLDMVGFGSAEKELHRYINKQKLTKFITIHGKVNKSNVGEYYSKADIFILPSYTEGLPVTLLEAIVSKNVCIVTNVGDMAKIVSNNDYVIQIESLTPHTLAKKIGSIIKNYKNHKQYFEELRKKLIHSLQ